MCGEGGGRRRDSTAIHKSQTVTITPRLAYVKTRLDKLKDIAQSGILIYRLHDPPPAFIQNPDARGPRHNPCQLPEN